MARRAPSICSHEQRGPLYLTSVFQEGEMRGMNFLSQSWFRGRPRLSRSALRQRLAWIDDEIDRGSGMAEYLWLSSQGRPGGSFPSDVQLQTREIEGVRLGDTSPAADWCFDVCAPGQKPWRASISPTDEGFGAWRHYRRTIACPHPLHALVLHRGNAALIDATDPAARTALPQELLFVSDAAPLLDLGILVIVGYAAIATVSHAGIRHVTLIDHGIVVGGLRGDVMWGYAKNAKHYGSWNCSVAG